MAKPLTIRDRVIGLERIPAKLLQSHAGNWRRHPQLQADAMAGVLREVGIAGALLVYQNDAGEYVTIDGHLRKGLDPEQLWPCLVLDVDDAEAAYLLATHDPLSAMAEANTEALSRLLHDVQSGEAGVQAMLERLGVETGVIPPDNPEDHWQGMPAFEQEDQEAYRTIKVHFQCEEDVETFAQLLCQSVTDKTKYVWYPEQKDVDLKQYTVHDESRV